MTKNTSLLTVLAALLTTGCYNGVDIPTGAIGIPQDSLSDGSPPGDDGDDPAPDGDDEDDSGADPSGDEPDPEPSADPFEVPNHEVKLLPFGVRMNNLAQLLAVEKDHYIFDELYIRRTSLGDHDYANGVAPDLSWSPTKMSFWVKGLKPVCTSTQWQARYPNISADPSPLLRDVLARDPDADELAAYQDLASGALNTANADELTCLAALSSLDFVAQ